MTEYEGQKRQRELTDKTHCWLQRAEARWSPPLTVASCETWERLAAHSFYTGRLNVT